ncbi:exported protein of unknown function [Pararobbsia alpina]|uniref:hypothetical protein n=1 Tax=Pararobbsia alpina TaxID=621374 RepID=UPI0039A699E3
MKSFQLKSVLTAAALMSGVVATNAHATDVLQWVFKRGDSVLAGGRSDVTTDKTGLLPADSNVKVGASNFTVHPYVASCTPAKDGKPVTGKAGESTSGVSITVERVGAANFHVVAKDAHLTGFRTTKSSDGCQFSEPEAKEAAIDQVVTVTPGEKFVLPVDTDHSVELTLTTTQD